MNLHSLNEKQLSILRHMLGINVKDRRNPKEYRDYYCANPGDEEMHGLATIGMVRLYSTHGGYEWFTTTNIGKDAARKSQRKMLLPKPKRIYCAWLRCEDGRGYPTFKEFLNDPEFSEIRRLA